MNVFILFILFILSAMNPAFQPTPNREAMAILAGKKAVTSEVFHEMEPEIRARAFSVTCKADADVLQRVRDLCAKVPEGAAWKDARAGIVDELSPYLTPEGAEARADVVIRANVFPAYSSATFRASMADDDTTALQYIHGDSAEKPTLEHEALDGTVAPKDSEFWDDHTGPWGHPYCVCYVRPMNEDLVAAVKDEDADKNPEDQRVMEGPALDALENGTLLRGTRSFNVATDPDGFKWNPRTLALPAAQMLAQFDPIARAFFETRLKAQMIEKGLSAWDWFMGGKT